MAQNPFALVRDEYSQPARQPGYRSYAPSSDKYNKMDDIKSKVEDVRVNMKHNIDKTIERGTKIEDLQGRVEELEDNAHLFYDHSRILRRKMWWKKCKLITIVGFWIIVLLILLILVIYYETK